MKEGFFCIILILFYILTMTIPFLLGFFVCDIYRPTDNEVIRIIETEECDLVREELDYLKYTMSETEEPLEVVKYITTEVESECEPCLPNSCAFEESQLNQLQTKYWALYKELEQCLINN